jgi:hypothetical protein
MKVVPIACRAAVGLVVSSCRKPADIDAEPAASTP